MQMRYDSERGKKMLLVGYNKVVKLIFLPRYAVVLTHSDDSTGPERFAYPMV